MRKEVKLGFAVGGILLSIVIVYALISSQGQTTPEPVQLVTSDNSAKPADTPMPAPTPAKVERDPIVAAPIPASQPIAKADDPKSGDDKWIVLHTGLPAKTDMPTDMTIAAPTIPTAAPAQANTPTPGGGVDAPTAMPRSNAPAAVAGYVSPSTRPSASATPRTHVIASGENFWNIAAAVYGNANYAPQIIRANATVDPRNLKVGSTINIPPLNEATPIMAMAARSGSSSQIDSKSEYRVEQGDSLYRISMKLYGKPDQIEKLYDLNKTTIGPDRARLKLGTVLKLPEAPVTR